MIGRCLFFYSKAIAWRRRQDKDEDEDKDDYVTAKLRRRQQKKNVEKEQETPLEDSVDVLMSMVCLPIISQLKWTAHHQSLLRDFLKKPEERILCCNVLVLTDADGQKTTRLSVNLSLPLGNVGAVWFFLKTSNVKINKTNFSFNLNYGIINTSDPASVQHFFDKILQNFVVTHGSIKPALYYDENKMPISDASVSLYVNVHHSRLVNASRLLFLLGAELIHQVSLIINEPSIFVPRDALKFSQKALESGIQESDNLYRVEELLFHWIEQLHLFLFKLGKSPSSSEMGLLHEIRSMISNAELLKKVLKAIDNSSIDLLLEFLESQHSAFPFLFLEVKYQIKVLIEELDSNCQQLLPLETPLERIYVDPIDAILHNVFDVMVLLKILWDKNDQLRHQSKMKDYFLRLSWEIVRACQYRLPLGVIFAPLGTRKKGSEAADETRGKESLIENAITCCELWRKWYKELLEHFKKATPNEQWLPEVNAVFLPLDLFVARCEDLRFIWQSKFQLSRYNSRGECKLTLRSSSFLERACGPEVDLLEKELYQVDSVLQNALVAVEKKSKHVFVLTSKEWLKYFDSFREKIEEIEQRYRCIMVSAVQTVGNTSHALEIINIFRPLAARKSLFTVFFIMMDNVLDLLEINFEKVERDYVFRALRVGKHGFSFCEMASWAAGIRKKLEQDINVVKNQPWLPYYPRLDAMYSRWSKTSAMLLEVVETTYHRWVKSLSPNYGGKLRLPVFKWKFDTIQTLEANFDQGLYAALREAKEWEDLGYDVPDKLQLIYKDSEKLFELIEKIEETGSKFNRLMKSISSDETQLFEMHCQQMVKVLYPGLTSIIWNQRLSVVNLCQRAVKVIDSTDVEIKNYLERNSVILKELESLRALVFYNKLDYNVYQGLAFQEDLLLQRNKAISEVNYVFKRIENTLVTLQQKLAGDDFPQTQTSFVRYANKVESLFLKYLKDILKRSFLCFEGLLMGCRSCPSENLAPVFEIQVKLEKNQITCYPSLDVIQETIKSMNMVFETSFAGLPCLSRRFNPDDSKTHSHQSILQDNTCKIMQNKLNEEFRSQSVALEACLSEWSKFRDLWEVDTEVFFAKYSLQDPNMDSYKTDITAIHQKIAELNEHVEFQNVGIFRINYIPLLEVVREKCNVWTNKFLEHLYLELKSRFKHLKSFLHETEELLKKSPDMLTEVLKTIEEYKEKLSVFNDYATVYTKIVQIFKLLIFYNYPIPQKEEREVERLNSLQANLKESLEKAIVTMNAKQEKFRKSYMSKHIELNLKIELLKLDYKNQLPTRSLQSSQDAEKDLNFISNLVQEIQKDLTINDEFSLLGLPLILFPEIDAFQIDISYLKEIWTISNSWKLTWSTWAGVLVSDASSLALLEILSDYEGRLTILVRENDSMASRVKSGKTICKWEVGDDLFRQIEFCKLLVPLIEHFQNSQLKTHHWEKIKEIVATDFIESSENFTVGFLHDFNFVLYQSELNALFHEAADEIKTEDSLSNIESLANQLALVTRHVPNIGMYIIEETPEITDDIKDLLMSLSIIAAQDNAVHYADWISGNKDSLNKMSSILELVEEFQEEWLKWNAFFLSPDVRNFFVNLSLVFDSIKKRWLTITSLINSQPQLREIALNGEAIEELRKLLGSLQLLRSFVEPYLIDRCITYSRFCFLSSNDLQDAVSTIYDGDTARAYLKSLFTNIDRIKQQKNQKLNCLEIIGVYSKEGEFLELNQYVPIGGEIDIWLSRLESSIQTTLKESVKQCRSIMKSVGIKVDDVVKVWPLQVSILSFLLQWSSDLNKMVGKNKTNEDLIRKSLKKIIDTSVRLTQVLCENIPKLQREKLKLFFLNVLQIKDQLESLLKSSTFETTDFIAYNWDKDLEDVTVQIKPYILTYSWEYQGLWKSFVFTCDLFRCISNVVPFLTRGYSLGILGRESVGKTETIKFLSRFCGRNFKSVSLSEEMGVSNLMLLILGSCRTPTWLVFENANHIPLTYLPTLGDNWRAVKENVSASMQKILLKPTANLVKIDGLTVKADSRAALFFEINSDKSDSSAFLEAVKDYCRPVVVIPPSDQILAECLLAQTGLEEYMKYALKISSFLKLLSRHFPADIGTKFSTYTLSRVVSCFEKTFHQSTGSDFIDLIPSAIKTVILPQLKNEEILIFDDTFESVFSDFDWNPPWKCDLRQEIKTDLEASGNFFDNSTVNEILHLYEIIKSNQKILMIGTPKSGKTRAIQVLSNSLNKLSKDEISGYRPVVVETICPQGITKEMLYGSKYEEMGCQKEGYFVRLLNKSLSSSSSQDIWIVLEGFNNYSWIDEFLRRFQEETNTFKSHSLLSLEVPETLKFIINISGLGDARVDPKRAASFYFDKNVIPWRVALLDKLERLVSEKIFTVFKRLIELHLSNLLDAFQLSDALNARMTIKVEVFITILTFFLPRLVVDEGDLGFLSDSLTPLFVFSVIWSFGSEASSSQSDQINEIVAKMTDNLPADSSVVDLAISTPHGQFCTWEEIFKGSNIEFTSNNFRSMIYAYMSNIFMSSSYIPILIKGDSGSGKSTVLDLLLQMRVPDSSIALQFSAVIHPWQLNDLIKKVNAKPKADIQKAMTVCIDELHCFQNYEHLYDVLSYLRYILKHKLIFDQQRSTIYLQETNLCCAFKSTAKGQTTQHYSQESGVDNALSQTFHILTLPPLAEGRLQVLFDSLYNNYLYSLEQDVNSMKAVVNEALSYLYFQSKKMLTNEKMLLHHPNLIDGFVKGIALCNQEYLDRESFLKVFIHECHRAFYDRGLIDLSRMREFCNEIVGSYFCLSKDIIKDQSDLLYTRVGNADSSYGETTVAVIQNHLGNSDKKKPQLIIFSSMIRHLLNITRVIGVSNEFVSRSVHGVGERKSIGGNILLVGPEGCGKKSCVWFASLLSDWKLIELEGVEGEETALTKAYIQNRENRIPTIVLMDLNYLEDMKHVSFINPLLRESKSNRPTDLLELSMVVLVSSLRHVEKLYKFIPSFFSAYSVDTFLAWNEIDLKEISAHILKGLSERVQCFGDLDLVCDILYYIQNSFQNKKHESGLRISSSKFILMINLVLKYAESRFAMLKNENYRLASNIEQYEKTAKSVESLSNQLKSQHSQVTHIQQTCGNTVLKMRNIKSEQNRLEQELQKKSSLLTRQREEALRIRELINRDLNEPRNELENVHKELVRISKEDFDDLKMVLRPSPSVQGIFEIVMIILGYEPSWNEVKKQVTNSLDFISKVRRVSIEDASDQILSQIHISLSSEKFSDENINDIPSIAYIFLKWINIYLKYSRIYKDYHPLKMQADALEKDMEETQNAIKSYQYDLANFSVQHKVMLGQLQQKESALENAEEKMKSLESKIQLAQCVMEQLNQDKLCWEASVKKSVSDMSEIVGNSILMAGYITYLGYYKYSQRSSFMESWRRKMKENGIEFSESFDILSAIGLDEKVKWESSGLKMDKVSMESVSLLMESPVSQIVFDPLDILSEWLQNNEDFEFMDIQKGGYGRSLIKNAREGRICFLRVDKMKLPYLVRKILYASCKMQIESKEAHVMIGKTVCNISKSFKFLIIVSTLKGLTSCKLSPLLNFVNVDRDEILLHNIISYRLFEKSEREVVEMMTKHQKELLEKNNLIVQLEAKIQELITHFEEALSKDSNLMESLQSACIKAAELRSKCSSIEEALTLAFRAMNNFVSTATQMTQLYQLIDKLTQTEAVSIGYQRFISLVVDDVFPRKIVLSWGSILNKNSLLLAAQNLYRFFQQQETGYKLVAAGLVLSTWYEHNLGLLSQEVLHLLYKIPLKNSEETQVTNPCSSWLPDETWNKVVALSQHETFIDLTESLQLHCKIWHAWCWHEQPENATLPRKIEKAIKGVGKLVLIRILRPDRFLESASAYTERVLRLASKPPTVSSTLISLASAGNFYDPIILKSSLPIPIENTLKKILPVCHPALTTDTNAVQIGTIGEGREQLIETTIQSCSEKGYWVVLKSVVHSEDYMHSLQSQLQVLRKTGANRRFRLWFYNLCNSTRPRSFFLNSTILISIPSFLKESIEHLLELLGENKLMCYTNDFLKLHLISLALLHIACEQRQLFLFDVNVFKQKISEAHWIEAESILRDFVTGTFPESNTLSSVVNPLYTSGSLTESYFGVFSHTVKYYLSHNVVSEISSSVKALTHYSVPRTCELADHLKQLEYVYKAPSWVVTNASQTLFNYQKIVFCRKVEYILYNVWSDDRGFNFQECESKLCAILSLLNDYNYQSNQILRYYFDKEISHLKKIVAAALAAIGKCDEVTLLGILSCIKESESSLFTTKESIMKIKMKILLDRTNYLIDIGPKMSTACNLDLGKFREPLCLWSWYVRKVWLENTCDEVVAASLTRSEDASQNVGLLAEGQSEVLLENMFLVGGFWDEQLKRIKKEESPYLSPLMESVSILVTPLTDSVKKIFKTENVFRMPVCKNILKHDPLFWIYVALDLEVSENDCAFRGIRFLLS